MALTSALVDKAHTIHRGPVGPKVRGDQPMGDVPSTAFKCRVSKPDAREIENDKIAFTEYTRDVTMLTGTKRIDGTTLEIKESWRVVIEDGPFAGTYEVIGDPTVIRKKQRDSILGYTVALKMYQGKTPQ